MLSKVATSDGHIVDSTYFDGWKAFESDPYCPTDNPLGVIQMGLAEFKVATSDGHIVDSTYFDGWKAFESDPYCPTDNPLGIIQMGLAEFKIPFPWIVMSGGATGAHEMLAFCLANPGNALLIPTLYFLGFDKDLKWRTGAQLYPVMCESSNVFMVTMAALELSYAKAQEQGIRVKGLLINNPYMFIIDS